MIKMIIGGEEVVSNKEFTINEEMLSASSTILNNCYPKSWEDNKDYTSNFYYPKDYSKFLLGEGEFLHGISEYSVLTVSGEEFIQFETNVDKEWNSFNVYGKTYQATRSGKNLLGIPNVNYSGYGITIESTNGVITISGTTTGTLVYDFNLISIINSSLGTLTKSLNATGTYNGLQTSLRDNGGNSVGLWTDNARSSTNTISGDAYKFRIQINSGITINTTIKPQIEVGSSATSWEQYGVQPSPQYPSELVNVGYENLFNWDNPREITLIKSTNRTINATPVGTLTLEAGTYTLSFPNLQMSNNNYNLGVELIGVIGGGTLTNNYRTFTISETKTLQYLYIYLNNNDNDNATAMFSQILLTKGNQAHSYIPYGKYGIEIKNTGKNLLDFDDFLTSRNAIYTEENGIYNITNMGQTYSNPYELNLKPNTTYTISQTYQTQNSTNLRLEIFQDSTLILMCYATNQNLTTRTFTTNSTSTYKIRANYTPFTSPAIFNKPILEENLTSSAYEPYQSNTQVYQLDEPLRAIGQYQDKLYVNNGVLFVERNVGKLVFNGSETDWSNQGGAYDTASRMMFSYNCSADIQENMANRKALSNYFVNYPSTVQNPNVDVTAFNFHQNINYSKYIYFKIEKSVLPSQDVEGFKSWLSTHNTEVQFELAEPIITPIGYVNIPNAYEGQNTTYLYTGLETTMDVLYYWKNFNVLFAGVVKNTGDISLNPRYPHYCNLQILDYKTFLSESNTLDFVIANKTVKEAIGMVVNAISGYGFILGEINIDSADDIIGAYSTLNKTAYDVLQYLANISGSRWRARYVDSSTMAIDFYDPDTLPQGADIEYTQEYWENNNIVDLTFNYGTRDYRNKQILLSDEVYANINYNETLISNGYTNTFTLQNNIGTVVNILVGNEEKTVATTNDKQMGIDADFYYAPGKNIIESNSVYSAGTLIKITYQPLVKGRQIVYNTNEVDRISTQTDTEGIIARYENRNDILSSDELEKIAQTYIEYKGKAEVILTLTTRNNDLYNIGEVVYFDAPIPDLAQNYMVKTKKTEYIVIDEIVNLFYIYEMTSSFNSEKAINYFDNQRNKASGNIAEGDSITRNIDIETDVAIIWTGGTVSSASITVDGDNVLNSVLNSPFVE